MNIVGECFDNKITEQIKQRQAIYGSVNRDNQELTFLNNKTGWCKLVSSVDVDLDINTIRNLKLPKGSNLAKDYILFNGIGPKGNREGISRTDNVFSPNAYGLGGNEMGLKPMPGIKQATIKTETRGSIKRATVQIQANNRQQFDIIDLLYMRLGYSVLLEWGNSSYYDNNGKYQTSIDNSLANAFINKGTHTYVNENNITQTVDVNYKTILDIIQAKRLTSCGNYDAMFAKVVNFSWTFTKEGTYDITINLISLGDVIESLKTNVLLGKTYNLDNSQTEYISPDTGSAVVASKDSNEIASYLYAVQNGLSFFKNEWEQGQSGTYTFKKNGSTDVIFIRQRFENYPTQYYVKLGHILEWIQENLIYNINNDSLLKIVKIDTNEDSNIIHILGSQFSNDPRICITNEVAPWAPNEDVTLYSAYNANTFRITYKNSSNQYGKIMNIYFNFEYIINKINSLSASDLEGKVSIYDLLNVFCQGWNNATGNYNALEPVIDTEENIIKIVDKVTLPDRDDILQSLKDVYKNISTVPAKFNVYRYQMEQNQSYAGFVKDLNFTTTVSPKLATMMTVGSTNQGYVLGQDATALSRMNSGLTDRFKKTINSTDLTTETLPTLEQKYKKAIKGYNDFIYDISFASSSINYHLPRIDEQAISSFSQTQKQIYEYSQASSSVSNDSSSPNVGFLPFDLSLTMDGLSGMKVYQKFEIDSDFLPTNYPDTLEFIIKGITHTIQNNVWNTNIESMAVPKNPFGSKAGTRKNPKKPANPSVNPTDDENVRNTNTNTPLLIKALTNQADYVFTERQENSGLCANYSFNIAYKIKEHIDRRSNTAITFTGGPGRGNANVPSGGNADSDEHRKAIRSLGLYDEYYLGFKTPNEIKQWISNQIFNYGDILNYYSPGNLYTNGKFTNAHTQIYTGTLYNDNGSLGWTTSRKNNYGFTMVYPRSPYTFKLYYYKIKPEYQI